MEVKVGGRPSQRWLYRMVRSEGSSEELREGIEVDAQEDARTEESGDTERKEREFLRF
jgi:hypothetical protein